MTMFKKLMLIIKGESMIIRGCEKYSALENFRYYNRYFRNYERNILIAKIKGLANEKQRLKKKKRDTYVLSVLTRHHLLAYAFLRKIPYNSVEIKCNKYNKPNEKILCKIVLQCISTIYDANKYANKYCESAVKEWLNESGR